MTRKTLARVAVALLVLAAAGAALRARQGAGGPSAPASAPRAEAVVELAAGDVVRAETAELTLGLPVTGALRAVNSAFVKARAAGELQGLAVREGDAVRAGQTLARIDPTEAQARLRQAREQADAARAQVEIARRQYDNNQALVDQGFISRTALESSQSTLAGASATHQAALAAVDSARKALDDTTLVAPIAGLVSQRLAQPGERLAVDARVLEIVDPSRLELECTVSAADSVRVRPGQAAQLAIEGLPQPVTATVARINPSALAGTRSVPVYLTVAPAPGLRQGLFAQGQIAAGRTRAVAVPLSALRTDKPAPYLQLVEGDRVVHRPVTPGARGERAGEALVAVDGLAEGASVLLGHVGALREGTAVRFTRPAP
ncbi:efflux RND transporter periplasmic adaptor subunit [Ramlibacter sp. MAHUQ-53]|uniref:efflux RND transporter periplasmic adaptor subunit n=1 Tax=unclassified Ramlibacter TaxID=2617605 RepID=UPI0036261A25